MKFVQKKKKNQGSFKKKYLSLRVETITTQVQTQYLGNKLKSGFLFLLQEKLQSVFLNLPVKSITRRHKEANILLPDGEELRKEAERGFLQGVEGRVEIALQP